MNLFDLVAKITLDDSDYNRSVDRATEKGKGLAGTIGGGLKTAAAIGVKALAATATGVATLSGFAVKAFADYEQLTGGVETLFKESSSRVMGYAKEAYKTAGMSANEYMETVTGFSASLLQSLGGDTKKAADVADKAIKDMSDNANKMGSDMKSIQFAYQGFAKQNYTMLDNLKLGYGGTKAEMERLLEDAEALSGQEFDISSYADIIEAIHIIQEDMGITGTTAEEAAETISGSFGMLKASFQNLVTGMGDEWADLDTLTDDFVESLSTFAGNLLPIIEQSLEGIKEMGVKLAPKIAEGLSEAAKMAPQFITAGLDILQTLGSSLVEQAPSLIDSAFVLLTTLLDGMNDDPGAIFEGMATLLETFVEKLEENGPTLYEEANELLDKLIEGFVDYAPDMVIAAIELIAELCTGLLEHVPENVDKIIDAVNEIAEEFTRPENLARMADAGKQLGKALINALPSIADLISIGTTGLDFHFRDPGYYTDPRPPVPETDWGQFWDDLIHLKGLRDGNPFDTPTPAPAPSGSSGSSGGAITSGILNGMHGAFGNRIGIDKDGYFTLDDDEAVSWVDGSHASGLDYVPYDGYIAQLHEGERVLTRRESEDYRSGAGAENVTININVEGARYEDETSLAEAISEALQALTDREAAVYG